jgi:FdhD protein
MGRVTIRRRVLRFSDGGQSERADTLVAEEPLEVRVGGRPLSVTMRTPGDDFDLVAGFLVTEGIVRDAAQLVSMRYCAGADQDGANTYNVIDAGLAPGTELPELTINRNFYTTSSCGLCGKASIDAIRTIASYDVAGDPVRVSRTMLAKLPETLRAAQRVFSRTGGLHAAGVFTADGELLVVREDVGRHNAVDKVIGWAVRDGRVPLRGCVLLVSGRASFELTQKALMAGIPALAAVSAPSSLAVELAEEAGMSLIGFLRGASMNVYTGAHRIVDA